MKVVCDRSALQESLNLVGGVTSTRSPKPVLACVKIAADAGGMTLAATDTEIAIRRSSPQVQVEQTGEALVPADKLNQIVRESSDPTLTLENEDEATHVRGQDAHFKVFGYPVADFPEIPGKPDACDFEVPAERLSRLIHQTSFATARENSRYAINGVLLEREGQRLSVVATDGRRLALAKGSCRGGSGEGEENSSAIVPARTLGLLQRLLQHDEEGDVGVQIVENQILFVTGDGLLASNLVEGRFPPYQDVIPQDQDKKATLGKDVFQSAVRRAALLTSDDSRGVKLSFSEEGLTISSRAPEMGEAEIEVPLSGYEGDPIEIGFNPQFVLDVLKVLDVEETTLEMKAGNKPGTLRAGAEYTYVIMPVSLQS